MEGEGARRESGGAAELTIGGSEARVAPCVMQELRVYLNGAFRDGVNSGAIPLEGPK